MSFSAHCWSKYKESSVDASWVAEHSRGSSTYCERVDFPGTVGRLCLGGAFGRNKKGPRESSRPECPGILLIVPSKGR